MILHWIRLHIAIATIVPLPAVAWEISRSAGPLPKIETSKAEFEKKRDNNDLLAANAISFDGNFSRRTVAYPYRDGASLGQGWDYVTNTKKLSSCINFKAESDLYQEATYRLEQAIDIESLDVGLNVATMGEAHGSYAGFTAGAEAKSSFDTKYHTKSKDEVLVAHASVVNGATFVTPIDVPKRSPPTKPTEKPPIKDPSKDKDKDDAAKDEQPGHAELRDGKPAAPGKFSVGNLQLAPDMAKLAVERPEDFRQMCGDGFIASIVSGADLYILYHFRDVDRTQKLNLQYHSKANAGFGALFGAKGSLDVVADVVNATKQTSLNIRLVQAGGVVSKLPVDLDTVKASVAALPAAAQSGPRPLFMIVMPYSALPNWSPPLFMHPTELRQKAISYQKRLFSAYFEYLNIRADFRHDADAATPDQKAQYFHDQTLRNEDIDAVGDQLLDEIESVGELIVLLDSDNCASIIPNRRSAGKEKERQKEAQEKRKAQCRESINYKLHRKGRVVVDFDDYKYWIRLPLPNNAIPDAAREILVDGSAFDAEPRAYLYSVLLYRHWVERVSDFRCRLFFECMKQSDRQAKFDLILASFDKSLYATAPGPEAFSQRSVPSLSELSIGRINADALAKIAKERALDNLPAGKVRDVVKTFGLYTR